MNPSSDPIHDSTVTKQIGQSTIVDHYGKINCPKNEGSSSREQRSAQEFKRVQGSKDLESTTGTSSGIFSDFVITFPIFLSLSCSARSVKLLNIFLVFFCLFINCIFPRFDFVLSSSLISSLFYNILFYTVSPDATTLNFNFSLKQSGGESKEQSLTSQALSEIPKLNIVIISGLHYPLPPSYSSTDLILFLTPNVILTLLFFSNPNPKHTRSSRCSREPTFIREKKSQPDCGLSA